MPGLIHTKGDERKWKDKIKFRSKIMGRNSI